MRQLRETRMQRKVVTSRYKKYRRPVLWPKSHFNFFDTKSTFPWQVMDGLENPEDFYDKNYYLSLRKIETIAPQKTFILNDDYGFIYIHR